MSLLRPFVLVLTLGVLSAPLTPQSVVAWEFTERGDGDAFDQALAVTVRGHVFAGGRINDDVFEHCGPLRQQPVQDLRVLISRIRMRQVGNLAID